MILASNTFHSSVSSSNIVVPAKLNSLPSTTENPVSVPLFGEVKVFMMSFFVV